MLLPVSVNVPLPALVSPPLPPIGPLSVVPAAFSASIAPAAARTTALPELNATFPVVCSVPPPSVSGPLPKLESLLTDSSPVLIVVPPL